MVIAIGLGCRRGCPAAAIVALVDRARAFAGPAHPARLFSIVDKAEEPGLSEAAAQLGLSIAFLPRAALQAVSQHVATPSAAAATRFGLPSVSEAAALAGAGPGARLLMPRIAEGGATCAVAAVPEGTA